MPPAAPDPSVPERPVVTAPLTPTSVRRGRTPRQNAWTVQWIAFLITTAALIAAGAGGWHHRLLPQGSSIAGALDALAFGQMLAEGLQLPPAVAQADWMAWLPLGIICGLLVSFAAKWYYLLFCVNPDREFIVHDLEGLAQAKPEATAPVVDHWPLLLAVCTHADADLVERDFAIARVTRQSAVPQSAAAAAAEAAAPKKREWPDPTKAPAPRSKGKSSDWMDDFDMWGGPSTFPKP